ncbi:MAG: Tad domain-containing protein [Candidatus Riflebacteria bacterium]|nr:Tad domain-containing protein [Candidatus Riflebacteria bacterium]
MRTSDPQKKKSGSVIMVALAMVFVVGLLSLVVDVGFMYSEKKKIETAASAGFRAGYDYMMELRSTGYEIDDAAKEQIKQRAIEVAAENLSLDSASAAEILKVDFFDERDSGPRGIKLTGSSTKGLFFANIFDFNEFTVSGTRDNDLSGGGGTGSAPWFNSCPMGIPNGVIEDLTQKVYRYTPFPADQDPHLVDREAPNNPNSPDYDPANPDFDENHGGDDESADYEGFVPGVEYILKLGNGGGSEAPITAVPTKILIPMVDNGAGVSKDSMGQSTEDAFIKAYGVAYWCLRINASDTDCHLPVEWLLGYKGGAFLLPWGSSTASLADQDDKGKVLATRLKDRGIKFKIIVQGSGTNLTNRVASITAKMAAAPAITATYHEIVQDDTALQDIYDAVGEHVLTLDGETGDRFKIGVYSSQSDADAVAQLLKLAEIPYGNYNPARTTTYDGDDCDFLYDSEIINGGLTSYKWLHMHHEDFTGFTGGCSNVWQTCYNYNEAEKATAGEFVKTNTSDSQLCPHCTSFYLLNPAGWGTSGSDSRYKDYILDTSNNKIYKTSVVAGNLLATVATQAILVNRPFESSGNIGYAVSPGTAATFNLATCGRTSTGGWYHYWNRGASSTAYPLQQPAISIGAWQLNIPFYCYFQIEKNQPSNGKVRIRVRDIEPGIWPATQYNRFCDNYGLRCAERQVGSSTWYGLEVNGIQGTGTPYLNFFSTHPGGVVAQQSPKICRYNDGERPQCQSFKSSWLNATTLGFSDDIPASFTDYISFASTRKLYASGSRVIQSTNPTVVLPDENDFIKYPNRVQKMKYKVVRLIRDHIDKGGFLYSQCFAPETLDMALWHARIYERSVSNPDPMIRITGINPPVGGDYDECIAFQNFHNKCFFNAQLGSQYYSSVNTLVGNGEDFSLEDVYDPRCQTHGSTDPSGGSGHTASFYIDKLATNTTNLGTMNSDDTISAYCKGQVASHGSFTFMGGHFHENIQTKRLVLNNVLLGAISRKTAEGEVGQSEGTLIGRSKSNYGCLDTDNTSGGGANDYRDRLSGDLNDAELDVNYRITTESGNMVGPSDQGVASRTWHDLSCADPTCIHKHCLTCDSDACIHTKDNTLCPVYNSSVGTFTPTNPRARVIVPITDVPPSCAGDSQNSEAVTIYDLQGNDHPNGAYLPEEYNFQKSPRIIGFGEFEILPPCCFTRIYNDGRKGYKSFLGPAQSGQIRGFFVKYIIKPNPATLR